MTALHPGTDLVRKGSIEELCGHRARALQLYRQSLNTLRAAQSAHRLSCAGEQYIDCDFFKDVYQFARDERFDEAARTAVDRNMWRFFIDATPLGSLMDGEERKAFEASLNKSVPEITLDTVFATMARLAGDGDRIFRRGLVNAFRGFYGGYKSHDGFKIGKRFLVTRLITAPPFHHINHHRIDQVRDLDRCMHVLDGKPAPGYQEGILAAIRTSLHQNTTEASTDYFQVRLFFGNGNAHFYPRRADLVECANRLIAEHYGEALGTGHSARKAA